jgi:crotonobetainyl-CoA:carnitine CoA-transferase CaiB-like acyl-CoA transferase
MVWAGPYCGRLLASLGADVVKIEGPRRPDGTRTPGGPECSGVFGDLNRGKSSLVLDLAAALGRQAFLKLVDEADVVVENFTPRVMPNLGLDWGVLSEVNPRLIAVAMPAFGADGPWAHYVAYGSGIELASGLARFGLDGLPYAAVVPYTDYLVGAYGAAAALAGLIAREDGGRGSRIEVAQREVACQLLAGEAGDDEVGATDGLGPESLVHDPHLLARNLFASAPARLRFCYHYARPPWRIDGVRARREPEAPDFGANSRQILESSGRMPAEAVDELLAAGIVVSSGKTRREGRRSGKLRSSAEGNRRRLTTQIPTARSSPPH